MSWTREDENELLLQQQKQALFLTAHFRRKKLSEIKAYAKDLGIRLSPGKKSDIIDQIVTYQMGL